MKQQLQKYVDGIDAMALRERAMFFGAVALVLMTLLQVFLLNPVLSRGNLLSAQIAQQEAETKAIQDQIETLVRATVQDPNASNRDRLKSLRQQLQQSDQRFEQQQKQFVTPEKMAALLENMIGKNPKLQLVSLRKLPSAGVSPGAGAPTGVAGGQAQAAGARDVYRHTVELTVKGGYFDLLDYLATLERLPQRLFWDGLDLSVAQYPQSVLKLTVYTLSPQKSWLTV
jgi:MSHA biogenesis protein MshJ